MYGAFIGNIIGSKYELKNIKTKQFPLFSEGCTFTDATIMTAAVTKAIIQSIEEQSHTGGKGKGFQEFLIETMQDFGRRYKTSYGSRFSFWLHQENPQPYNSFGNGAAMRVSPCGLVAVEMEEALALARITASVSHNHPEGVKGAEAVAAAVYLAKCGKKKETIKQYITEHYYPLNFTIEEIQNTYTYDSSCQGSVPQAITAFLESDSYEDAIRNSISIGGDSDTIAAITSSIAWTYYAIQSGDYFGWVEDRFDSSMLAIREQAKNFLADEFIRIADEFHEYCWRRAGTYNRVGICSAIMNKTEEKKYLFA